MTHIVRASMVLSLLATLAVPALADEDATVVTAPAPHKINVSLSPLRAVVGAEGDIGADYALAPKMSIGLTLGLGPYNIDNRDAAGDFMPKKVLCFTSGLMYRYFFLGNFDKGPFGGAEVDYIYVDRDDDNSVRPEHEGLWAGPQVGYKYTFGFGMVLAADLTVGFHVAHPHGLSKDQIPGGMSQEDDVPVVGGVLLWPNATVGWAF